METVGFKHESSDPSFTNFSAVRVVPDYDVEETVYTDINDNLRKLVETVHKVWEIRFGYLDETAQDFLVDLKKYDAPQMYYDSTTINIRVKEMSIRATGASLTVAKVEKES